MIMCLREQQNQKRLRLPAQGYRLRCGNGKSCWSCCGRVSRGRVVHAGGEVRECADERPEGAERLKHRAAAAHLAELPAAEPPHVILRLEGITSDGPPGNYQIYLNYPQADRTTAGSVRYYVGLLAGLGVDHHHGPPAGR